MRPSGVFDETYAQSMAIIRTKTQWGMTIGGLLMLFMLPFGLSGMWLTTVNLIGISLISALGLNLLTGLAGQISIGQTAFMAVGAYTVGLLAIHTGLPFWLTLPSAGLVAGVVGVIFGAPSLRVKGFYLVMATLAAQMIIPWLVINVRPDITGGTANLRVPAAMLGNMAFTSQRSMFYLIMPVAVLMTLIAKNISRTKTGRAFTAIGDNDLAAEVLGISLFRYKLIAFFICSAYAGIAGGLWAYWMRSIAVTHFTIMESIWYLGMVIVGGMGSVTGTIMGTVFVRLLDILARLLAGRIGVSFPEMMTFASAAIGPILFGLVILVFLIFESRGLYHRWQIFKTTYQLWPFSY